jgi:hypothetical protein
MPVPNPCIAPDQITEDMGSCIEKCDIIHSDIAVSTKPADDQAHIEAPDRAAHEQHGDQRAGAARRGGDTRLQHRIPHESLQQRRQQRQRREQHDAHQEDQDIAGQEIAVLVNGQRMNGFSAVSVCVMNK